MSEGLTMSQLQERNALLVTENEALKAQRDALAAENAELKELYRQSVKELDDTCFEIGMMRGEKSMEYPSPETPATDAYLNSVRAEAVVNAAAHLGDMASGKSASTAELIKSCGRTLLVFAEKLRAGEPL